MANRQNDLLSDSTTLYSSYYNNNNTTATDDWNTIINLNNEDYSTKEFLKDLVNDDKSHWLIRFLDVFLYGGMLIVEWIEKKLKHERKENNPKYK